MKLFSKQITFLNTIKTITIQENTFKRIILLTVLKETAVKDEF